jgi:hypothetical protein
MSLPLLHSSSMRSTVSVSSVSHIPGAAGLGSLLADLHDQALGLVDELGGAAPLGLKPAVGDVLCGLDESAQAGALAHHLRVGADIRGTGGVLGELGEVGVTAGGFQLTTQLQLVRQRDHIHRFGGLGKVADLAENQAVIGAVEILGADQLGDAVPGILQRSSGRRVPTARLPRTAAAA